MNAKKITAVIIVLMLSSVGLNGYFVGNVPCALDPDCTEGGDKASGPSLYGLIVNAGASFLQSNSDYQQFLNKVELSGQYNVSSPEMSLALDQAITQIESAQRLYAEIYDLCLKTVFNAAIMEKLQSFDYDGCREKNQLNPIIFDKVTAILKDARLADVYLELYLYAGDILDRLKEIREAGISSQSPQLPLLWRANQTYMNAAMFGQYTSIVLMSLK